MGVVYKALDPKIDRILAIKTISARLDEEPDLQERFRQEARSAARLSHQNIITIYDYDEEEGLAYLAMEYLEGEDLKSKIRNRASLSLDEKLRIMAEVCEGLSHAHKMGIVHRDVKPGNIFITTSGEVKILDFGLARLASSDLTKTGVSMGTPAYMSPEQLRSEKVDFRSDIFSAGVLFYELLTYKRPFHGNSDFAISIKILQQEPDPIEIHNSSIPPDVSAIVLRALAKERSARYRGMDEMVGALGQARTLNEKFAHIPVAPQTPPGTHVTPVQEQKPTPPSPRTRSAESVKAAGHGTPGPAPPIAGDPRGTETVITSGKGIITSPIRGHLLLAAGALVIGLALVVAAFFYYRQAPLESPGNGVRIAAAGALLEKQQFEEAIVLLQGVLTLEPENERARQVFERAVQQQKVANLLEQARELADQKHYEDSRAVLNQILAVDPNHRRALALRDNMASAIAATGRPAVKAKPIAPLLAQARTMKIAGKLKEAQSLVAGILKIQPYNPEALSLGNEIAAGLETEQQMADEAMNEMDQLKSRALSARASILSTGLFDQALEIENHGRNAYQGANYPSARNSFGTASELFRRAENNAREADMRNSEARKTREAADRFGSQALALFHEGKYQESRKVTESWILEDPQNIRALQLRSRTARVLVEMRSFRSAVNNRRYDDARRALEEIARLNPKDPNIPALRRRLPVEALRGPRSAPTLDRSKQSQRTQERQEYTFFQIQAGLGGEKILGRLIIDGAALEFRTEPPEQGFRFPRQAISVSIDGSRVLITDPANNKLLKTFRTRHSSEALAIKKAWDSLR